MGWQWTPARICRLRKKLGLSQAQFGRLVGMHQPTVAALESGRKEAGEVYCHLFTYLDALCDTHSVDQLNELLRRAGKPSDDA